MSEEMNRREAALSDADLASVNGGRGEPPYRLALDCCENCDQSQCRDHFDELVDYIHEHGEVWHYRSCPFYPGAEEIV